MIVSKPKSNALFAMGIFIAAMLSIGGYGLSKLLIGASTWYYYAAALICLPVSILLFVRQLISYKVVQIGDNKIVVRHPLRASKREFSIKELEEWKEVIIKTKAAPYKQLEMAFANYLLKLTVQENTFYEQIVKYLRKKAKKKELQ